MWKILLQLIGGAGGKGLKSALVELLAGSLISAVLIPVKLAVSLVKDTIKSGWNGIKGFNSLAVTTSRELGLNYRASVAYTETLIHRTQELAAVYGVTAEHIAKVQDGLSKATGRAQILTSRQAEHFTAISKVMGESTATSYASTLVRNLGGSLSTAQNAAIDSYVKATKVGLSASQYSEKVAQNLSLANSMTFRNGVDGIMKMTALSERLGFNLSSIGNVVEKFSDFPEAISNAAQLQALGGNAAIFGANPLTMMYESLNDVETLTERVTKMVEGYAKFNTSTGVADLTGMNREMVVSIGKALGIGAEEAVSIAKNAAKAQFVESRATSQLAHIQDKDLRDYVINKADYDPSTQRLKINDKNVEDLSIEELSKMQREDSMSDREAFLENAKQIISFQERMVGIQSVIGAILAEKFMPLFGLVSQFLYEYGARIATTLGRGASLLLNPNFWLNILTKSFTFGITLGTRILGTMIASIFGKKAASKVWNGIGNLASNLAEAMPWYDKETGAATASVANEAKAIFQEGKAKYGGELVSALKALGDTSTYSKQLQGYAHGSQESQQGAQQGASGMYSRNTTTTNNTTNNTVTTNNYYAYDGRVEKATTKQSSSAQPKTSQAILDEISEAQDNSNAQASKNVAAIDEPKNDGEGLGSTASALLGAGMILGMPGPFRMLSRGVRAIGPIGLTMGKKVLSGMRAGLKSTSAYGRYVKDSYKYARGKGNSVVKSMLKAAKGPTKAGGLVRGLNGRFVSKAALQGARLMKFGAPLALGGMVGDFATDYALEHGHLKTGGFGHYAARIGSSAAAGAGLLAPLGVPGMAIGAVLGGIYGAYKANKESKEYKAKEAKAQAAARRTILQYDGTVGNWGSTQGVAHLSRGITKYNGIGMPSYMSDNNTYAQVGNGQYVVKANEPLEGSVVAKPVGEATPFVKPNEASANNEMSMKINDFNINVSGTIRLEGGNASTEVDVRKLLNNQQFIASLTDTVRGEIGRRINGGRMLNDSSYFGGSFNYQPKQMT